MFWCSCCSLRNIQADVQFLLFMLLNYFAAAAKLANSESLTGMGSFMSHQEFPKKSVVLASDSAVKIEC